LHCFIRVVKTGWNQQKQTRQWTKKGNGWDRRREARSSNNPVKVGREQSETVHTVQAQGNKQEMTCL